MNVGQAKPRVCSITSNYQQLWAKFWEMWWLKKSSSSQKSDRDKWIRSLGFSMNKHDSLRVTSFIGVGRAIISKKLTQSS